MMRARRGREGDRPRDQPTRRPTRLPWRLEARPLPLL